MKIEIKCHNCGREVVLDEMENCPNCGVWLGDDEEYHFTKDENYAGAFNNCSENGGAV